MPGVSSSFRAAVADFWSLTKPEVNFLILIATSAGFYLGSPGSVHPFPFVRLLNTLWGTLLVASGTGTLNQYMEHRFDAQMRRTRRRPIASGRVRPSTAAWFGIALSVLGAVYLFFTVNALASALAVFTLTTYLFIYTPLKRKTTLCTLAGAVPGAMPPLIGWAAASGSVTSSTAWMLYALLFLWQFPHFMAIAWMYREDYDRAAYRILPSLGADNFLSWLTMTSSVALLAVSVFVVATNTRSMLEYSATVLLTAGLFYFATRLALLRSRIAARQLLKASIVYLPLAFLALALGRA